jgi:hypothetical protein
MAMIKALKDKIHLVTELVSARRFAARVPVGLRLGSCDAPGQPLRLPGSVNIISVSSSRSHAFSCPVL